MRRECAPETPTQHVRSGGELVSATLHDKQRVSFRCAAYSIKTAAIHFISLATGLAILYTVENL